MEKGGKRWEGKGKLWSISARTYLSFSVLGKNTWGNLVDLANQLVHGIMGQMLLSEFSLGHVAGVGLAENSVAITGHDLTSLEGGPQVVRDGLVAEIVTNGSLHLLEPVQDLLVGKTVEGTGETVETSGKREHGRAESASDQVGGVGADVATFVISVDGEVQSQQLNELLVCAKAKLVGKVETIVLVLLDWSDLTALEDVLVDSRGNGRELGDQIHRVLESVAPVFRLPHSLGVCLGERRFVLESIDCDGELCHWVQVARASVDQLLNKFGDVRTGRPLGGEVADLLFAGDFTSQEQPEETLRTALARTFSAISLLSFHTFWQRLVSSGGFGKKLLAFWNCLSSESNTLLGIEDGPFPDERLDSTRTTVDLVQGNLSDNL